MPDGDKILSEQNRSKLDGIVKQMIANNESDDNINFVVNDFKSKYGEVKKNESQLPESGSEPSASLDTESPSPNVDVIGRMGLKKEQPKETTVSKKDLLYERKYADYPELVQKQKEKTAEETQWKPTLSEQENLQLAQAKNSAKEAQDKLSELSDPALEAMGGVSADKQIYQQQLKEADNKIYVLDTTSKFKDDSNYISVFDSQQVDPLTGEFKMIPIPKTEFADFIQKFMDEEISRRKDPVDPDRFSTEFAGKKFDELTEDQKNVVRTAFVERYVGKDQIKSFLENSGQSFDVGKGYQFFGSVAKGALGVTQSYIKGMEGNMPLNDALNSLYDKGKNGFVTKSEYERLFSQIQEDVSAKMIRDGKLITDNLIEGLSPISSQEVKDIDGVKTLYTYSPDQIARYLSRMPKYEDLSTSESPYAKSDHPLSGLIKGVSDSIKSNPIYKDSFWLSSQPQALGSTIGFVVPSLLGQAIGVNPTVVAGITGAFATAQDAYDEAIRNNATPSEASKMFLTGFGIGTSEAAEIEGLFHRLGGKGFFAKSMNAVKQGSVEALQEGFQNLSTDYAVKQIYDESKKVGETFQDDVSVGFVTGALFGGIQQVMTRPELTEEQKKLLEEAKQNLIQANKRFESANKAEDYKQRTGGVEKEWSAPTTEERAATEPYGEVEKTEYSKGMIPESKAFTQGGKAVSTDEYFDKKYNQDSPFSDISQDERHQIVEHGKDVTTDEKVDASKINPTQELLDESMLDKTGGQKPVLVKYKGEYYVVDGHHRIAAEIKSGNKQIEAKVVDYDRIGGTEEKVGTTEQGTGETTQTPTTEDTGIIPQEINKTEQDAIQKQKTDEMDVRQQAGDGEGVGEGNQEPEKITEQGKEKEVKPIRQLGTGANVYFESKGYRVNDGAKEGEFYLNVGATDGLVPVKTVTFQDAKEAVYVAKELEKLAPEGLVRDYHNVDKIVDNLREQYKSEGVIKGVTEGEKITPENLDQEVDKAIDEKQAFIEQKKAEYRANQEEKRKAAEKQKISKAERERVAKVKESPEYIGELEHNKTVRELFDNAKTKKAKSDYRQQLVESNFRLRQMEKGSNAKYVKPKRSFAPKILKGFASEGMGAMTQALHYFAGDGRVNTDSAENDIGYWKSEKDEKGKRKIIKGKQEYNASLNMIGNDAPSFDDIANELTNYEGGNAYDEMLSALHEAFMMGKKNVNESLGEIIFKLENNGYTKEQVEEMREEMRQRDEVEKEREKFLTEAEGVYGSEDVRQEAERLQSVIDEMTDEEKERLYNGINQKNESNGTTNGVSDTEVSAKEDSGKESKYEERKKRIADLKARRDSIGILDDKNKINAELMAEYTGFAIDLIKDGVKKFADFLSEIGETASDALKEIWDKAVINHAFDQLDNDKKTVMGRINEARKSLEGFDEMAENAIFVEENFSDVIKELEKQDKIKVEC